MLNYKIINIAVNKMKIKRDTSIFKNIFTQYWFLIKENIDFSYKIKLTVDAYTFLYFLRIYYFLY